jgi:ERCC4-related helicase
LPRRQGRGLQVFHYPSFHSPSFSLPFSLCAQTKRHFRILALSATPGSTVNAVQNVIDNLLISHLEIRSDEDLDVRNYVHDKKIEVIKLSLGDQLGM